MTNYDTILRQAGEILDAEPWHVAAMSNLSALLMASLDRLNWAGFYFVKNRELIVGPFQGQPACIRIPVTKGVCGTAVRLDETQVVPDVHLFPGHVACDSRSESEIVIPIHADGRVVAVLDMDSIVKNRFSAEDTEGLKEVVRLMEEKISWNPEPEGKNA